MADELILSLEDELALELNVDEGTELVLEDSYISQDYHPTYQGSYVVEPFLHDDQELQTEDKIMLRNVTVKKIPVIETTNPYGGRTVVIG